MIFLVLRKILHYLHVPITDVRLRDLIAEQSYQGSLRTIKEVLSDLDIEVKVYQLDKEDLNLVECPVIIHFKDLYNTFVVVVDIQEDKIKYYNPIINDYNIENKSLFFEKWTGTVLVPFTNEQDDSWAYLSDFKCDMQNKVVAIGIFSGIFMSLVILLVQTILNDPKNWIIWALFLLIKVIALVCLYQIVTIELGESNTLIMKICNTTDCGKVLHSKASKLFSWLTMGDMGMIYFGSGALLLIIASFLGYITSVIYLLFFLNIFALPYTLFSVIYQRFVVRNWCPFCLSIMGILWIEFLLGLTVHWKVIFPLSINLILLFVFWGIVTTVGWLILKKILIVTNSAKSQKMYVNAIKKDIALFKAILSNQIPIPEFVSSSEIVLGNENAKDVFIAIISMDCHHCSDFYQSIQRFLSFYPDKVKIIIRFKSNEWDNEIIEYLLTLNMKNKKEIALSILEDWYSKKDRNNVWKRKFGLNDMIISDEAKQLRKDYHDWFLSLDTSGTPAMILNNKLIPTYYTFKDIKYFLKILS